MESVLSILIAILVFGVLIFVHELGHFLAARVFGVKVNEFAIGMGPKLISHKSEKSGTVYSLRLLPIGGFNSIEGENGDSTDEAAFCVKPVWQRMIIIVAGALFNLIFAVIVMSIVVIATDKLGSTVIAKLPEAETSESAQESADGSEEDKIVYVGEPSNTAEKFMVGDRIVKINGKRVHVVDELVYTIAFEGVKPATVTVVRNGETVVLENVSFPKYESGGIVFGTVDFFVKKEDKNIFTVIKHSWFNCVSTMETIWESIFGLLSGKYGMEHVSGPVGVTEALGSAAQGGILVVMNMAVMISMNLGVFNLLPLPALDGGRFIFLVVEAIRRKPLKAEVEGMIHTIGILVLMALMVVITFKDVFTILK